MKVLSVQIGTARPLSLNGRQVMSAFRKTPVPHAVQVAPLGLQGDEQVNLSVHGGLSKAVYAYPYEHYAYWEAQAPLLGELATLPFGSLGENLTLSGLLERDVFIGDELHFPDCVLRVTEPRQPCATFNAAMGDKLAARKMAQTGFSGFYLAVKRTGTITAGESFEVRPGDRQVSVGELFKVAMRKTRSD